MLIAVISDSHDNISLLKKAIAESIQRKVERIIHCGDIIAPFSAKILAESRLPVIAVFGNNDGEKKGLCKILPEIVEPPLFINLDGKDFLISHEPIEKIPENIDFVIFGHTHKIHQETRGKTLILNPGECGGWLTNKPTFAILDTTSYTAEIISL